ncbi:uncharacterized protein J3R85_020006 [Psidium guajava]|nr:uncharacterized protein J3R85_020006 [Psidium guajava]
MSRRCQGTDDQLAMQAIVMLLFDEILQGDGSSKGGGEHDETVEQAASREALEEAGFEEIQCILSATPNSRARRFRMSLVLKVGAELPCSHLLVKEQLESWPEQSARQRSWLTVAESPRSVVDTRGCERPWEKVFPSGTPIGFQETRPGRTVLAGESSSTGFWMRTTANFPL